MARHSIRDFLHYSQNMIAGTSKALLETAEAIKDRMAVEGAPVQYPIQWDSDRQKRAYFASDGFGSGIPYQRTNAYVTSGQAVATPRGARYTNRHPAGAIGGTQTGWQSRIHEGRWTYLPDVLEQEIAKLPDRIRQHVLVEEGTLDANS